MTVLFGNKHKKERKKLEFSKSLLVQESALIWINTIAYLILAFVCIKSGFTGSLPWLTAGASLPWAAYGVSQVYYYKKSTVENAKNGIKYDSVMKELEAELEKASTSTYNFCQSALSLNTNEQDKASNSVNTNYGI